MAPRSKPMTATLETPAANHKAVSIQDKFASARRALKAALVERDDEIDLVLTALVAQEHPLLVGPPGTGKSLLLDSVMRWLGKASKFSVLLTKFSTPEEVFGPVSVQGLKADKYTRITTGKLPEAEGAFVDEIFKASSAILNTMLRILNERQYDNGDGTFRTCPLKICVAASNEWPSDDNGGKELGALFDRFLFRKTVRPVSPAGRRVLLRKAVEGDACQPRFEHTITAAEIDRAHEEAKALPWSNEAKVAMWKILEGLAAEGINPGDRRQYKAVLAARAYAYLCGAAEVRPEHLEVLAHVLWDDPTEQPRKAAEVVARHANPAKAAVNGLLVQAEDVVAKTSPTEAVPKLQSLQKELAALPRSEWRERAEQHVAALVKTAYNKVIGLGGEDE